MTQIFGQDATGLIFSLVGGLILAILIGYFYTAKTSNVGTIVALNISKEHKFSKESVDSIELLTGLGIKDDCHAGKTVQHLYRIKTTPNAPNLRQVLFIHAELFDEFARHGHVVKPGELGENITTKGLDLLNMSVDTKLHFLKPNQDDVGTYNRTDHPIITITGLRNPCPQIEHFQKGLQKLCVTRDSMGSIVTRKAGVMGIVTRGGEITTFHRIIVERPRKHVKLEVV